MNLSKTIPVISPGKLDVFHFKEAEVPFPQNDYSEHFHINTLEDVKNKLKFPIPPHRKTVYDFIFLERGHSVRSKNLIEYKLNKNTFFFLPANQVSEHNYLSKDVKGYYCHFSLDLLVQDIRPQELIKEYLFLNSHESPIVQIDRQALVFVQNILSRLMVEYRKGSKGNLNIFRKYLLALFAELKVFTTNTKDIPKGNAWTLVENFKELLAMNIYSIQKITDYAKLLNISPNHLNKCVKKVLGRSSHDLINEMLLLESKVLLKQTSLSIKEIAYKIGKSEISDFDRFFKSQTGMTPTEFRVLV